MRELGNNTCIQFRFGGSHLPCTRHADSQQAVGPIANKEIAQWIEKGIQKLPCRWRDLRETELLTRFDDSSFKLRDLPLMQSCEESLALLLEAQADPSLRPWDRVRSRLLAACRGIAC